MIPEFEPEELHPELQRHRYKSEHFGWDVIKHPLVFSICHTEALNKHMNQQLRYKLSARRLAFQQGDWHSYVFLHERPYRVQAFTRIKRHLTDSEYWQLLTQVWIDSENIRQNPGIWQRLLNSDRAFRYLMMSDEDYSALQGMPVQIEVFQGHTDERDDGYSWTTNRTVAEWFARRFADLEGANPVLSFGRAWKSDIIAYLRNRNEDEILVPRNLVQIDGVQTVRKYRSKELVSQSLTDTLVSQQATTEGHP